MLKETKDKNEAERLLGEVSCLDPRLLVRLNIASACLTVFESECVSIRRYSYALRHMSETIKRKERIDVKTCGFEYSRLTLEQFFYADNGVRLNVAEETAGFKAALIEAIRTYQALDTSTLNTNSYNANVLLTVIKNATQIASTLRLHTLSS